MEIRGVRGHLRVALGKGMVPGGDDRGEGGRSGGVGVDMEPGLGSLY